MFMETVACVDPVEPRPNSTAGGGRRDQQAEPSGFSLLGGGVRTPEGMGDLWLRSNSTSSYAYARS